jgi:hypothetical protein
VYGFKEIFIHSRALEKNCKSKIKTIFLLQLNIRKLSWHEIWFYLMSGTLSQRPPLTASPQICSFEGRTPPASLFVDVGSLSFFVIFGLATPLIHLQRQQRGGNRKETF